MEVQSRVKRQTSIKLNPKQHKRIAVLALNEARPFSEMLRLLLDEALEQRERKAQ